MRADRSAPPGPALRTGLAERLPQPGREGARARLRFVAGLTGGDLAAMVEEEFRIASSLGTPEAFAQIAAMVHAQLDAHPLVGSLTQRAWRPKALGGGVEHDMPTFVDFAIR